jgi:hypothetical protein
MQVLMAVQNGKITMHFEQQNQGVWHSFQLCSITVKHLALSYSPRDPKSFCIALPWKGRLVGSIYCRPADNSINLWLLVLQRTGARMQTIRAVLSPVAEGSAQTSSSTLGETAPSTAA